VSDLEAIVHDRLRLQLISQQAKPKAQGAAGGAQSTRTDTNRTPEESLPKVRADSA
jgi:hypothetical protein